jgi:hypothetical protein
MSDALTLAAILGHPSSEEQRRAPTTVKGKLKSKLAKRDKGGRSLENADLGGGRQGGEIFPKAKKRRDGLQH